MPRDSLHDTLTKGDRLASLRTLRDNLGAWLEDTESARDRAALSQRLMDVLAQIDACEKAAPEQKGTALDEFTKRRAEREAASPPRPAKRQQRRG